MPLRSRSTSPPRNVLQKMKVANVEAFTLGYYRTTPSRFYRSFALVKVTAGDGTVGWGEASDGYGHSTPMAVKALVDEELRRLTIDREFDDPAAFVADLRSFVYRTAGADGLVAHALSGVEMAIWDVAGKVRGQSISHMIGRRRERIPVYAAGTLTFAEPIDWYGRYFREWLDRGMRAVKARIGHELDWDVEMVHAVRQYIGPEIEILVDGKFCYTERSVFKLLHALAPARPYLLEEPVPTYELSVMKRLVAENVMPIAYGENVTSIYGFRCLVAEHAATVLQPDATIVGIAGFQAAAEAALGAGLALNPHNGGLTAIGMAANVHMSAVVPEFTYLEYDVAPEQPLRDEIVREPLFSPDRIQDGALPVPDGPGLGIDVDEDSFGRFPYERRPVERENATYGMPHL